MKTYAGGTEVPGGFYIDRKSWHIATVDGERGALPGDAANEHFRLPTLTLFLVAPLLGALFVIFLPFIGFAMLFEQIGKRVATLFRRPRTTVAAEKAS